MASPALIQLIIDPREKDLGGFSVRRILPYAKQRMVGPFIFFDHLGPAEFAEHHGIDVRPHPHIGLSTVTYLFDGELLHRDTLGCEQLITEGAVNWMTAGRGIAHSERTAGETREHPHRIHGIQSWVALPKDAEETAPAFHHHPKASLPEQRHTNGALLRLIAGQAHGEESPVSIHSPLFYAELTLPAGAEWNMTTDYSERAIYLVEGELALGSTTLGAKQMAVLAADDTVTLRALSPSRIMLLGGESLAEPRFIWWNFVSSSEERIEAAKADWEAGRFGTIPNDTEEFIPLPTT